MSITTYSELKDSIANWTGRGDLASGGANINRVDEIIDNAEAMINNDLRTLEMETTNASFPVNAEYVAVPSNFGGVRSFKLNVSPRAALTYEPDDSQIALYTQTSGQPRYFNVTGGNFRFAPIPGSSYTATLVYYLKVPSLNSTVTQNWLLTSHPHIYLMACQMWAYTFLKDAQNAATCMSAYKSLMQDLKSADRASRWGGNGMAVRVA